MQRKPTVRVLPRPRVDQGGGQFQFVLRIIGSIVLENNNNCFILLYFYVLLQMGWLWLRGGGVKMFTNVGWGSPPQSPNRENLACNTHICYCYIII